MAKKTHRLPQTPIDEETRKTWDEMLVQSRLEKMVHLVRRIAEDVAIFHRKTGTIFTVSTKTREMPDKTKSK